MILHYDKTILLRGINAIIVVSELAMYDKKSNLEIRNPSLENVIEFHKTFFLFY